MQAIFERSNLEIKTNTKINTYIKKKSIEAYLH